MNGFTNTFLTLLLGWLRVFITNLWHLIGSEDGGSLYSFLAQNWKLLVVLLCVGGFVVDRVIYFIRWRPYYVWSSKLNRLRRKRGKQTAPPTPAPQWDDEADDLPSAAQAYYPDTPQESDSQAEQTTFAPIAQAAYRRPAVQVQTVHTPQNAATQAYAPATAAYLPPSDHTQATVHYAPLAHGMPQAQVPYRRPYEPPRDLEPVFDDEFTSWAAGETLVRPLSESAFQNPAYGMEHSFGSPKPEPIDYIRDMQAGFAPTPSPEQLYTRPPSPSPLSTPETAASPVHPGLNSDAFRQNFGLTPSGYSSFAPTASYTPEEDFDTSPVPSQMHVPTFMPYAQMQTAVEDKTAKTRNPFANIAKKARDLVGVENEDQRPTIHDLQPAVDMRTAFHKPVYPKPKDMQGGD
ncbi:MAG: hypothetical protein RR821_01145 [Clostridia bacterium]